MIIGLIPARFGSKGCPGKNFAWFDQQNRDGSSTRVQTWQIQQRAACGYFDYVYLSTDAPRDSLNFPKDGWVGMLSREGHPSCLPTASLKEVVEHAVGELGCREDCAIAILSPTFTRRRREDVSAIVNMYNGRSIIGVTEQSEHPYLSYYVDRDKMRAVVNPDENRFYRRQDYPRVYRLTTFACIFQVSELPQLNAQCFHHGSYPQYVHPKKTHDIDTPEDLEEARQWIQANGLP